MKKLLFIFTCVCFSLSAFAQFDIGIGLSEGYQTNIFNNPDSYERKGILYNEDSLYANSFYTDMSLSVKYRKKWDNNTLKIKASGGGAYFYTSDEAHKYRYKLEVSYRTKYGDGKYFEIAPHIFRIRKNGIDQTETILRTPYSYQKFAVPFNFDFYLGNKAWLKIQPAYLFKKYDTHDPEKLYYHSWYINAELKKKWVRKKVQHVVSFTGDLSNRFYSDYELPKEDFLWDTIEFNDLTHKTRQWEYYVGILNYSFKTNDNVFRIDFPIKYVYKNDKLRGLLSYHEIIAGYSATVNLKKWSLSQSSSYSNRNYSKYMIDDTNLLKYNYLRLYARLSYQLNDAIMIYADGRLVDRKSNRNDITKKFYRGYFTYYTQIGVRVKI